MDSLHYSEEENDMNIDNVIHSMDGLHSWKDHLECYFTISIMYLPSCKNKGLF